MTKEERQRTIQQNKALHKFCTFLSEALNDAGYDMKAVLREDVEIPWTPDNVKDNLWRPIMRAATGKTSTADMDTKDPSIVYEILNKHLSEKFGVHVPWPDRLGQLIRNHD